MTTARVTGPINRAKYRALGLTASVPKIAPDQLCLDGFEERLSHGMIIAFAFAAHRDLEAVLGQALLILI